jgi:hypothetical protein
MNQIRTNESTGVNSEILNICDDCLEDERVINNADGICDICGKDDSDEFDVDTINDHKMEKLTQSERIKYVSNLGKCCPKCGADNNDYADYGSINMCIDEVWQDVVCSKCEHNWSDVYQLSNAITIGESIDKFELTVAMGTKTITDVKNNKIQPGDVDSDINFIKYEFKTKSEMDGFIRATNAVMEMAIVKITDTVTIWPITACNQLT